MGGVVGSAPMNEWESHFLLQIALPLFWRPKTIDGQPIKTPYVMRRRTPDGTWQYRLETEEEAAERFRDWIW